MRTVALGILSLALLACDAAEGSEVADAGPGGKADDAACSSDCAPPWALSDVSVLFPAETDDVPHLLGPVNDLDGLEVVLLDRALFERLGQDAPPLTETPNRDAHYEQLRVTSMRLDPCVDGLDPHAPDCTRAIRVVMQPMWPLGEDFDIYDASIHLFYALDDDAWDPFVSDYAGLRIEDLTGQPLGVHPVLAAEGMDGAFGRALNRLLVDTCRAERIVRMTFMATGRSGNNWFWGGFDRGEDGTFARLELPGGGHEDSFHQHGRSSGIEPVARPDVPTDLLHDAGVDRLDDAALLEAVQLLQAYENPTRFTAENLACAACHLAAETKPYALSRRGLQEPQGEPRYEPAGFDLSVPPTDNRGFNMHAFSYFGPEPTVSPRVANESAAVVQWLEADAAGQ